MDPLIDPSRALADATVEELAIALVRRTMRGAHTSTALGPFHFIDRNGFDWGTCEVKIDRLGE
jgi:hypothetical protein